MMEECVWRTTPVRYRAFPTREEERLDLLLAHLLCPSSLTEKNLVVYGKSGENEDGTTPMMTRRSVRRREETRDEFQRP